jgi:hypothetical protein
MSDTLPPLLPRPPLLLPDAVRDARAGLRAGLADLLVVPDAALEGNWSWRAGMADIRYGFYRQYERLEEATADARRVLDETGTHPAPGGRILADAVAARWEINGLLAMVAPADVDADAGGEWTLRQVLSHLIDGQDRYNRNSANSVLGMPGLPPIDADPRYDGTAAELDSRLGSVLDHGIAYLGGLDDDELARPSRWMGFAVTVGFRLGRFGSHLREHTIQLDKTLDLLGRRPTEVERMIRHVCGAYGRLEGTVCALPPGALDVPGSLGRTAAGIVGTAVAACRRDSATIRAAAEAGAP